MPDHGAPPAVWDWLDSIWGFGAGIVLSVLTMIGWIAPKIKALGRQMAHNADVAHRENDHLAGELHGRISSVEKLIVILQENNNEAVRTYKRVESELRSLTTVTNQQTKLLYEMRGSLKLKGVTDE